MKERSEIPTARDVATAIVTACKHTGGDPEKVASGWVSNDTGSAAYLAVARARLYAGLALSQLFSCHRATVAKLVGVNKPTQAGFIATAERDVSRGKLKWFDAKVLIAIGAAVDEIELPSEPPPYRPPPGTIEKVLADDGETKRPALGTNGPDGYRPPDGTARRILEDEADDRPILGRNDYGAPREHYDLPPPGKQALRDMLADAARRTAAMAPKEGE